MQPLERIFKPQLIRAALAAVIAAVLAVTVLPAHDDLDKIRQEAKQGDPSAQFKLGVMYDKGEGVLKDDAEAARWFRLAAERGHASAQLNLGVMYYQGRGVLKDPVLANMWFNIAGYNGYEQSSKNRDIIEHDMTQAEISRATELAKACMASDYQDCGR